MDNRRSTWLLCPSNNYPGKFYYFNTKTGEKGWTLADSMNCFNSTNNKLKTTDPGKDTLNMNNSSFVNTQGGSNLPDTTFQSTFHLDSNRVDSPDLCIFKTQTGLNMIQNKHSLKQLTQNHFQKHSINQRVLQGQANLSMETNLPMNETSVIGNTLNMRNESVSKNPFLWRHPKRLFSESDESSSPNLNMEKRRKVSFTEENRLCTKSSSPSANNDSYINYWLSKYEGALRNPFSKYGVALKNLFSKNEVALKNPFSLRQPKPLKHLNKQSRTFNHFTSDSITSQAKYKPLVNNPFSSKVQHVKQKKTYYKIGRTIEDSVVDTQTPTLTFNWDFDDAQMNVGNNNSQLQMNSHNLRKDNVKVDIKFLRNISKSKDITEWWLVPDVDVLLESLDFLKEFVVQDLTCSVMSPAAVLKMVYLMRDDCRVDGGRATVAEQAFQWLAAHAVCEVNEVVYPLEETVIYEEIIKSCVKAKIQHLVLVTKSKQLMHAAKMNGIHAYYLNDLQIQQETVENDKNNTKNNLFLQKIDNFDPFPISKKQDCMTENNNSTITNFNFTITKPPLQNRCLKESRLNNNGERIIVHNENLNNRKKFDDKFWRNIQGTVNRHEQTIIDMDLESDEIFPIETNTNKKIYFDHKELKRPGGGFNNNFFKACGNSKPNAQRKANPFEKYNSTMAVSPNECDESDPIEKRLNDFCTTHANLQAIVNDRLEEWSCCYLQIMEQFINEFFQQDDVKNFQPPYWFMQGLRCLREYYCRDKTICSLVDKLTGMSGFCIKNGVVRVNIKADQFLKILGAGMSLIERVENTSKVSEFGVYKDMLNSLVVAMQNPEEFPETVLVRVPSRSCLDDGAFSVVSC